MLTQAKADEAEQLEQLIEAAFIPYCQGLGREWAGPYPWLEEAIVAGRILWIDQPKGCAVIDRDGDTLKIEQIAIDPAHQGLGIGGRAMAALGSVDIHRELMTAAHRLIMAA